MAREWRKFSLLIRLERRQPLIEDFQSHARFSRVPQYLFYIDARNADIALIKACVERKGERRVTGYTGLVGEPGSSSTSESDSTRENVLLFVIRRNRMCQRRGNSKLQITITNLHSISPDSLLHRH